MYRIEKELEVALEEKSDDVMNENEEKVTKVAENRTVINEGGNNLSKSMINELPKQVGNLSTLN